MYIAGEKVWSPRKVLGVNNEKMELIVCTYNVVRTVSGWTGFNYTSSLTNGNELEHWILANHKCLSNKYVQPMKSGVNMHNASMEAQHCCVWSSAVAPEIRWKSYYRYEIVVHVLQMGTFHTTYNFLGIIGKRSHDAKLRDAVHWKRNHC